MDEHLHDREVSELREAVRLARELLELLGENGVFPVLARAQRMAGEMDLEAALHWRRVGRAMRLMAGSSLWRDQSVQPVPAAGAPPNRPAWTLMQRIEAYRHRAVEAERKAATGDARLRRDMIDIARQWQELAAEVQQLASESGVA